MAGVTASTATERLGLAKKRRRAVICPSPLYFAITIISYSFFDDCGIQRWNITQTKQSKVRLTELGGGDTYVCLEMGLKSAENRFKSANGAAGAKI
jgi:hypothetical protein